MSHRAPAQGAVDPSGTAPADASWAYEVGRPLTVEGLEAVATRQARVVGPTAEVLARTERGRALLLAELGARKNVYGVTTGFGDSVTTPVEGELTRELPLNLIRYHGAGVGRLFGRTETRAILASRLASLAAGYSAVRPSLFAGLIALLEKDVLPAIPELGSVGASGDLTPLSYVAAVLVGEREVLAAGDPEPARVALERAALEPLSLEPKESLSLMNGTSVMAGLAALALPRALRVARWSSALTAALSDVVRGQPGHFDERLFRAKPHPGQARVAAWIREDLEFEKVRAGQARLQDRYSIRCAPHVIGVLLDLFPTLLSLVEVELNSATDNPLADGDSGVILHGGHFYGGHVCAAMDTLKVQLANLVDLMDRQLLLLCQPSESDGLPANLVGAPSEVRAAHHGFKAMQITTSALAAEAAKQSLPASILSRSTESHNQDKVSMGTIAARDALSVLDLAETTAAILTLALAQAVDLRQREGCHQRALRLHESVRRISPFVSADRALDKDIHAVLDVWRAGELDAGEVHVADFRRS